MAAISNPHDKFFKATFGKPEVAASFLTHYLPAEVLAELELSTLKPEKDSFIDAALQEHFSDLLYSVQLKNGGQAFVYLLFEHKSTPEELVALQLLRYEVQIWEKMARQPSKKLPPILPLVIYHGRQQWQVARNFGAVIDWQAAAALRRFVPEFEYHLVDLSAFSEEEIRGIALARVGLLVLKYVFTGELLERLPEILQLLSFREQSALEYLVTVMRYLTETNRKLTREEFINLTEQLPTETGVTMETMAEGWFNDGVRKGRREGRKEGREEGRQEAGLALTLRLLQHRIGTINARTQARLHQLSFEQLTELGVALLEFQSARDLTAWLRTQARK